MCAPPCAATESCVSGSCKSRFTEFSVGSGSDPNYITGTPDGSLWFTSGIDTGGPVSGSIGRVSQTGAVTSFPIFSGGQNSASSTVYAVGIVAGRDGNVWFDAVGSDGHGYISSMTLAGVPTNNLFSMTAPRPGRVTSAPDGSIWTAIMFANPSAGSDVLEVSTLGGVVSEKTLPSFSNPYGIVAGPDGNIWITETAEPEIGRFKISDGSLSEFATSSVPQNITVGADGNLWFTEPAGKVGRSTVGGTILEFPAPNGPFDITKGPDGNVWFTEPTANRIGRITPGGQVTEFSTPASPFGIAAGADGNIWFTESAAGKVARFVVP